MELTKYHSYFMTNKYDISKKRKPKFRHYTTVDDYDILFFNLLNITKHESIDPFYNKNKEKEIKMNIGQKLDTYKFKQKEQIIQSLCYEENITLEVLNVLSMFFMLDIVYIQDMVFVKMLYSNIDKENYIIVNQNCDVYTQKKEKIDKILMNKYEIQNTKKPINSMSYYKIDDLKNIYSEMNIEYDERMKKKDAYEFLKSYFEKTITLNNK